jgi:beta-glucosidase
VTATGDYPRLVALLTLPAKVRLLTGASMFTLHPCEAIGLGELRFSDGPNGVRGLKFAGGPTVALLPNATLLASAWSEETAYRAGRILAEEAMAQGIHLVLAPTINLHRSPLGGRLFEAYSEDPLLTGKLAAAYVRGLQDNRIGACLKHLVANEAETDRHTVNSAADEATLRELYLLPFEIAVAESGAWSLMAAYNDVNGVPATEQHHVNNEIVKGEWGYDGLIMSDWTATKSAAPAANGGLDLVMPGPDGPWGDALIAAVEAGEVAEATIDEHLVRLLRLADRVGALGPSRADREPLPSTSDSSERREQLRRLAADGMTVLTNRDSVLPLPRGHRVALIGRHAVDTTCMGGGSARVNPAYEVSVAEGLTTVLGEAVTVIDGVEVRTRPVPARDGFLTDPETGRPGVRFTLYSADGTVIEERYCPSAATVVGLDDDLDDTVARVTFRARLNATGPVEVGAIGVGSWRVRVGGRTMRYEHPGVQRMAPPAGTSTVEARSGDVLDGEVVLSRADAGLLGVVARPAPRDPDTVIAGAAAAAAAAEVAVVVVGLTEEQETEGADKRTLRLPGHQDDLIVAVASKARRTVVVVNAATPVAMPWKDAVDAILWVGLPGQESGHAVAAALVGDIEPAGRLVTTFPVDDGKCPAWTVTPVGGRVEYTEGTFIGYRGYHAGRAAAPAFWFGHGLGYATWRYDEPWLSAEGDEITVGVTVTNTGTRDSREVVQAYFEPTEPDQPIRLVGWESVRAAPGESVAVRLRAERRMWRRWETTTNTWGWLAGGGRILLARGLGDVRATLGIHE